MPGGLYILFGGVRFGVMGVVPTVDVETEVWEVGLGRASGCKGFGTNDRVCDGDDTRTIGCGGEREREQERERL